MYVWKYLIASLTYFRTYTAEKSLLIEAHWFDIKQIIRSFKCSIRPKGRFFKTKDDVSNHIVYNYEQNFACRQCD